MPNGVLQILEVIYTSLGSATWIHCAFSPKSCQFPMVYRIGERSGTGPGCSAGCFITWVIYSAVPMLFEQYLWLIEILHGNFGQPLQVNHWLDVRILNKDTAFSQITIFPLDCYWAIVQTEHLTIGHQVVVQPTLPIMNLMLSDPSSQKLEHAQQHYISWG